MKHIFIINTSYLKDRAYKIKRIIESICRNEEIEYIVVMFNDNKTIRKILNEYQETENIIISVGNEESLNIVLNNLVRTRNIIGFIPTEKEINFYNNKHQLKRGINEISLIKINDYYCLNSIYIDTNKNNWITKSNKLKVYLKENEIVNNITKVIIHNGQNLNQEYMDKTLRTLQDDMLEIYLEKNDFFKLQSLLAGIKYVFYNKPDKTKIIYSKELIIKSDKEIEAIIDGRVIKNKIFNIQIIPRGIKFNYNKKLIENITNEIEKI